MQTKMVSSGMVISSCNSILHDLQVAIHIAAEPELLNLGYLLLVPSLPVAHRAVVLCRCLHNLLPQER